ncbi:MAG: tetraacyldisaccharide 4'-kinase [Synergistaceae bacterium]|nr:tetraacyldisaccharide 4'-kinase [Synergistaceae bacterium]
MLTYTAVYERYINYAKGRRNSLLLDVILTPCSWITRVIMAATDFLHSHGLLNASLPPVPVISVGNLTYGGTNKTPFTIMLAEYALSRGLKAGIVTRGYMGSNKSQDAIIITNGNVPRDIAGDEAVMISRKLPHVPVAVSKHRIDGVNALRDLGVELVIADDAFQHRNMKRDCDIVLVDALCPFGNGKLTPAGIMRENVSALRRAHMVVITKSSMVSPAALRNIYHTLSRYTEPENIFMSDISADGWNFTEPSPGARVYAFSATGSPETFTRSLADRGCVITGSTAFRDHHRYTHDDIHQLNEKSTQTQAQYIVCTEKDLANMDGISPGEFVLPLAVPKIRVAIHEPERFYSHLAGVLRPEIVIASNGYGEDAIASVLARKMIAAYPLSKVSAFPLVGSGEAFIKAGVNILSAKSVTPSAGIFKYSLRELWNDLRAGLLGQVREQLRDWRSVSRKILPPVCVGDVYLLANTLWGSGLRPVFVATAKTVYISGHWRTERMMIRKFTLRTWTRDEPTALQIGDKAVYSGSPIMDLLGDNVSASGDVILLLPGSRKSAGRNAAILLGAAEILCEHGHKLFRMVLAPTVDTASFFRECESVDWKHEGDALTKSGVTISLTAEEISRAAIGGKLLLGMGGTANQLCAGMGIPVIAPDDKGKRVQKKLLGNAEILTHASSAAMAECALRVLADEGLYGFMSDTGRRRMGRPGAGDDVVRYTRDVLGWGIREKVYRMLTP